MKTPKELKKEFSKVKVHQEWEWIIANKESISKVELDNDATYIHLKGDVEETIQTAEYLGNSDGVLFLLEAIGINAEPC